MARLFFQTAANDASDVGRQFRTRSVTDGGLSRRIDEISSADELPSKGRRPVAISCSITPKEKMSERWSSGRPETCSGDM